MKPQFLDRSYGQRQAFSMKENRYPYFLKIWHYHPEIELVIIQESTGTRFVGDHIEKFEPGEVVLLGKNLPHMWLNDNAYFEADSGLFAKAFCIHFKENFLGQEFFNLSGTEHLSQLLRNAHRGIRFIDLNFPIVEEIARLNKETDEFVRLMSLLQMLHKLAKHKNIKLLASEGYLNLKLGEGSDKTHQFIFNNFNKPIQLADVAEVAQMNPSAFSRYFKRIHRKTFSRYLIEIRIGFACKLLIENKSNISNACYESGFNNISNFNKQFKRIMNMNPSEYIRLHK